MLAKQTDSLIEQARATISSGKRIVVLGWVPKNHNPFTRNIPADKVAFLSIDKVNTIGDSCGLVILTRFINHSASSGVKTKYPTHPSTLGIGIIRMILNSCRDLFEEETFVPPTPINEPTSKTLKLVSCAYTQTTPPQEHIMAEKNGTNAYTKVLQLAEELPDLLRQQELKKRIKLAQDASEIVSQVEALIATQ